MKDNFNAFKEKISIMSMDELTYFIMNFNKCDYCNKQNCKEMSCYDNIVTYLEMPYSPFTEAYNKGLKHSSHFTDEEIKVAKRLKIEGYKYIRKAMDVYGISIYASRENDEYRLENQDLFKNIDKYVLIDDII